MPLPMKEVAKMLLMENKYSIIPVGPNKIPLVPWTEYQHRFPSVEEIDAWWDKFPMAMVGIVTGEISNLTVVDVEKGGDTSFLENKTDTTIVKTGGGGYHFYYTYAEGIKNATRIRPLVDIRSEGGYVVGPYSRSDKGLYSYEQQKNLLPFPRNLFPQKSIATFTPNSACLPKNATTNEISVSLLTNYTGYGEGMRNAEMARFIGKILCKINPVHWDTIGWAIVMEGNNKNTPPLSPRELQITWNSIKGIRVRGTPVGNVVEAITPEKVPSSDTFEAPVQSDEIKLMSVVAEDQKAKTEDVYPFEMPCFDEITWGGVCAGDLVVVSGQTGEGKTSLAQDWTIGFLRGVKKAPVVWFSYEVSVAQLWKKFKVMGAREDELVVVPAFNTTGKMDWLEEKVIEAKAKFGAKIVVIDHLGFLLPRVEGGLTKNMSANYATYVTQIVKDVKRLALKEGVVVILPVPMKKTEKVDTDAIRDSGGIAAEADLVFLIERERNRDRDAKTYFTDLTKITLSKNRKTGETLVAWFKMLNQRFAYDKKNKEEAEKEEALNEWGKQDEAKKPEYKNPYNSFRR